MKLSVGPTKTPNFPRKRQRARGGHIKECFTLPPLPDTHRRHTFGWSRTGTPTGRLAHLWKQLPGRSSLHPSDGNQKAGGWRLGPAVTFNPCPLPNGTLAFPGWSPSISNRPEPTLRNEPRGLCLRLSLELVPLLGRA